MKKLKKPCPNCYKIFTSTTAPHFAYLDNEKKEGYVVMEMKDPKQTNNIADFLDEAVVQKAIKLMAFNLDLQCEIEENCPFPAWEEDLKYYFELS